MKEEPKTTPLRLVYVTAPDRDAALRMARTVVTERLAACANVVEQVSSVYWWQGAVHEDSETAVILKTRQALVKKLTARLSELHSDDCPCVVSLMIEDGHPDFLNWVVRETS